MNKIKIITKWLVFILLVSIFIGCPTVEEQKHEPTLFLWKLETEKTTMYFLGSTHMANQELYPLDKQIEAAFAESDILVVEANIIDVEAQSLLMQMMEKMMYAKDDSIENHISPEVLAMVAEFLEKHDFSFEYIKRFKPWAVEQLVITMEYQALGLDPEWGLDVHFLKSAQEQGKQILELEGIEGQLNIYDAFSEEIQELSLKITLIEIATLEQEVEVVFDLWKSGKSQELYAYIIKTYEKYPELTPLYDILFLKRNKDMTNKLLEMIEQGGKYFVVVGAGHFIGPDSIIEILRKKHYKIEQF